MMDVWAVVLIVLSICHYFVQICFCICLEYSSLCCPTAFLWQLMRFTMLQLLKNLRSHSQGKEITDADILNWANNKVKKAGRTSEMDSFKVIKQKLTSYDLWVSISYHACKWSLGGSKYFLKLLTDYFERCLCVFEYTTLATLNLTFIQNNF